MRSARPMFLAGAALAWLAAGCPQPGAEGPRGAGIQDARVTFMDAAPRPEPPVGTPADASLAVDARGAADAAAVIDGPAQIPTFDTAPAGDASGPAADAAVPAGAVTWAIDNLQSIGGHRTMVLGSPTIIDTPDGKALQFDGQNDALFVDTHPLARWPAFTVEMYFRPDPGGLQAQRFFHMQANGSEAKVLFETRLFGASFVLDVFVESAAGEIALYQPQHKHPLGAWYHIAAVVDGQRARHYVNGQVEMDAALPFRAHGDGRTSIGIRITRMYPFKGAIRLVRFTPRALTPDQFLPRPGA